MTVTKISEHQSKDIVNVLETLLTAARAGQLKGLVLACKYEYWHHGAWTVGDYKRDPASALAAAIRLVRMLNRYADIFVPPDDELEKCHGCKFQGRAGPS